MDTLLLFHFTAVHIKAHMRDPQSIDMILDQVCLSFQVGSNLCQKTWRVQSKIPASHRLSTHDLHVVLNIHYMSVSPLARGLIIVKVLIRASIKYISIYYLAKTCRCCECLPHKRGYHRLGEQIAKECLDFMFHDNLFGLWWFKKRIKVTFFCGETHDCVSCACIRYSCHQPMSTNTFSCKNVWGDLTILSKHKHTSWPIADVSDFSLLREMDLK